MIKKAASGKYTVRIYHKGAQVTMRTFDRKKDAEAWETEQKRQLQRGSWVNPSAGDVSLGALIEQFNASRRGAVAEHTWDTDEANLRRYVPAHLKRMSTAMVSTQILEELFVDLIKTKARPTVSRLRNTLSTLFAWAETRGMISINPVSKAELPKGDGQAEYKVRPFTGPQLEGLVLAATAHAPHYGELIEFMALTGLRWGEAAALRVSAIVQVPHPALIVSRSKSTGYAEKSTKSSRVRRVPLIGRAAEIVAIRSSGKNANGLIFTGARGGQLNGRNFVRDADWAKVAPGHRVQDLRHTAATSWLAAGVDIKTVSTWLGHSDTSITIRTYIHWRGLDSDIAGIERVQAAQKKSAAAPVSPMDHQTG